MDALIGKLNALLVLITKDSSTGITVDGVGTAVVVDELSYKDVSKVKISLKVDLIEKTEATKSANIAIATTTLQNDNKQLFAAFDISLLKSVYGVTGDITSSKVSNSSIVEYITVRIPAVSPTQM